MSRAEKPGGSPPRSQINPPVFFASAILALLFVAFSITVPDTAATAFNAVQAWVVETAGWFYVLAVAGFLVFVVAIALSRFGRIRLGPDHSRPDYSYLSWFAMLFSAGMGIGLMFFGVAEPIMHFVDPPVGVGSTPEAARQAMRITYFHWGMHAWAIYAVVALSLAYFAYRHGLPLAIRSSLYPLIGERIHGPVGHAVDTFAVLGTLFGVATSLGLGVVQVNAGLGYLFGLESSLMVQMLLIAGITLIATGSVALGLDTGIRRISEFNMLLASALLLFVLIGGPTVFLLQTLVQNTGMYLSNLFSMTFNLYAYEPGTWVGGWTLFYWGWWIAWSPFVGMFIARISRGRTIREFVVGVLLVPVGFTFMWMTFFGGSAIHQVMVQGDASLAAAVSQDTAVALFQFFEGFPLSGLISGLATLLVVTFFVTSSDSGSLVVDMLTSRGKEESPVWRRVFWALMEGAIAAVLLLAGGLAALQTAAIASALPFAIVMLAMCWGLQRALWIDAAKRSSLHPLWRASLTAGGGDWQQRLRRILHHPDQDEVERFIERTVQPALHQVADELRQQHMQVRTGTDQRGASWIEVGHGEETDFYYAVRPHALLSPRFALLGTNDHPVPAQRHYRAEVHLREGGQNYDLMGRSRDGVIHDVLDQYQQHLGFLAELRHR